MRRAFSALAELFPLSLAPDAFSAPERRQTIKQRLDDLAAAAGKIEEHGRNRDLGFLELSQLLLEDSEQAARFFQEGRHEDARSFVYMLAQNCIDCHARFPSKTDFPLSAQLMKNSEVETLEDVERARLHVVTRSFDDALTTWERVFRDSRLSPIELDLTGQPFEYLRIALRVRQDPKRARSTLERFRARDDVPPYLRHRLSVWIDSLIELENAPPERTIAAARKLTTRGSAVTLFQDSREGLVYDLAASGILLEIVDASRKQTQRPQLGEAYFLLARLEDRLTQSFWSGQTESYLEAAIRSSANAGDRVGWHAYWRLEELVTTGSGGFPEEDLPRAQRDRLRELRGLLPRRAVEPSTGSTSAREEKQEIPLRENADQLSAVDDRHATDLSLEHDHGGVAKKRL
jgi:hypothetical protein